MSQPFIYQFRYIETIKVHLKKSLLISLTQMSIAAEELPLPRRDVRKKSYRAATLEKKLPRRDGL